MQWLKVEIGFLNNRPKEELIKKLLTNLCSDNVEFALSEIKNKKPVGYYEHKEKGIMFLIGIHDYTVYKYGFRKDMWFLGISVDPYYIRNYINIKENNLRNLNIIKEVVLRAIDGLDADIVYFDYENTLEPFFFPEATNKQFLSSSMVLNKKLVDSIGRDKVLNAPAFEVRELSDGSVFIQIDEDMFSADPYKVAYLGVYLFGKESKIIFTYGCFSNRYITLKEYVRHEGVKKGLMKIEEMYKQQKQKEKQNEK